MLSGRAKTIAEQLYCRICEEATSLRLRAPSVMCGACGDGLHWHLWQHPHSTYRERGNCNAFQLKDDP